MDLNPYTFNRDASYPTGARFPRNIACKDLLEAHIHVVVSEKSHGSRGDFTAEVKDIFAKYRLPHISSEMVMGLWQMQPMGFWQNQVNFAVWCSTTGCGVSWHDHLDIDRPLARSVFRFHMYYQVRRILDELQAPLPQDQAWAPFQNPYEQLCREFGVDPHSDWKVSGPNWGLGRVYNYWTNDGYHPVGNGEYDSSRMSFTRQTSNHYLHIDFIKQDAPNADTAWGRSSLTSQRALSRRGLRDWRTTSGTMCGRLLVPRRRPTQASSDPAPALMPQINSWQTWRMQYHPL